MFTQPGYDDFDGQMPPNRRTARWRRRFMLSFAAALLFFGVAITILYFQVTRSALNLEFVRTQFENALQNRLPPAVQVNVDAAYLSYRSDVGLIAQARDLAIDIPGRATIRIRSVDATANVTDLFSAHFNPHTLAAEGLDITLTPLRATASTAPRIDQVRTTAELVARAIVDADTGLRNAGYQELRVSDLAISVVPTLEDSSNNSQADSASLSRTEDTQQLSGLAEPGRRLLVQRITETRWAPLEPGRSKIWSQIGQGGDEVVFKIERITDEEGNHRVEAFLDQFPAAMLLPALGDPNGPVQFDALGSLRALIDLGADGNFGSMRARLTLGAGEFLFNRKHHSTIDGADLFAEIGTSDDQLALRRGLLYFGLSQFQISGGIDLRSPGEPIAIGLRLGESFVPVLGDSGAATVRLAGGRIAATLDPEIWNFEIERLEVTGSAGKLAMLGNIQFGGDSPGVALAIQLAQADVAMVHGLWPAFVAGKARKWFKNNIRAGRIGPGLVQVALPMDELRKRNRIDPIPDYAVAGTVDFSSTDFTPLPFFPEISDAAGSLTFENSTTTIVLKSGTSLIKGRGALDVTGSSIAIPRMAAPSPIGEIDLRLSGPIAAIAQVADAGPLNAASGRDIDAAALSGTGQLALKVDVPMSGGDALSDLAPEFELALTDFTSSEPLDGRKISGASLVLKGNPDTFSITGNAIVDGIPADLAMVSGSAAEGNVVKLTLDDKTRRRLGFDLGSLLTGPVTATFAPTDTPEKRKIILDLQDARINLPFAAWEKGFGVAGKAEFIFHESPKGSRMDNIVLSGRGFRATGNVRLKPDGGIASMNLDKVTLRPGDNFSVAMTADGKGYDIKIAGQSFDARGLISRLKTDSSTKGWDLPGLKLAINLKKLNGHNRVALHNLKGSVRFAGGRIRALSFAGTTGKAQPFNWEIIEKGETRSLSFRSANGGAALRFADLYTRILGGELDLRQDGPKSGDFAAGGLVLRNFRVINERVLAQAVRSNTGSESTAVRDDVRRKVNAANLVFSVLQIPFRRDGDVISLNKAALRGPAIGGTATGTVNLEDRQIAISGTFIPIYGINNIAGSIPLIGAILGGGRNEGLIGLTYRIFGPLDAPTLQMNPVSVIAPGIFRKIFEFR